MKLKNIFLVALATLGLAACDDDLKLGTLEGVEISKSIVSMPLTGGSEIVTISTANSWQIMESTVPSWLSVSPLSGDAGKEQKLTITTKPTELPNGTAQVELISNGKSQFINVIQGVIEATLATCKEVIDGQEGRLYRVTGTVTNLTNTEFGNFILVDETGSLTIYGVLDSKGKKQNFASWGIEEGDVITLEGTRYTYNESTIEFKDANVIKFTKSLLMNCTPELYIGKEGGDVIAKFVAKKDFTYSINEELRSLITIVGTSTKKGTKKKGDPDTTAVTINVQPYMVQAAPRQIIVTFSSGSSSQDITIIQSGDVPEQVTIAEGIEGIASKTFSHIKGSISAICNRGYVLTDSTASVLIYYGSGFKPGDHKVGDYMMVAGTPSIYNFGAQYSSPAVDTKLSDGKFTYPEATVYDADKVNALKSDLEEGSKSIIALQYAKITGTVAVSGNYVNFNIDGSPALTGSGYQFTTAQKDEFTALDGKHVELYCYVQSVSTVKGKGLTYLNFIPVSVKEIVQ